MKLFSSITFILALSFITTSLTSCGESEKTSKRNSKEEPIIRPYEKILQKKIAIYEESIETLENITNTKTAKKYIPILTDFNLKLSRLEIDLLNSEPISDDEKGKIHEKHNERFLKILRRTKKHMAMLKKSQPEARKIILEAYF